MKNRSILCVSILFLICLLSWVTYQYYELKMGLAEENKTIVESPLNSTKTDEEENTRVSHPSGDVGMKYPESFEEIMNLTKRDSDAFYVIGKTGCSYCAKYLPILEKTTEEYGIEIVYIDVSKLSNDDYKSLLNSELTILGKCNDSGYDVPLSYGFGTPLGLFVNGDETYDCLRGYKSKIDLVYYMKKIKYIE